MAGGAAHAQLRGAPQALRARPVHVGVDSGGRGVHLGSGIERAAGDVGVPRGAGGDHDEQLPQQAAGDCDAGLGVGEGVGGAAGEVGVPGGQDLVVPQGGPDRATPLRGAAGGLGRLMVVLPA